EVRDSPPQAAAAKSSAAPIHRSPRIGPEPSSKRLVAPGRYARARLGAALTEVAEAAVVAAAPCVATSCVATAVVVAAAQAESAAAFAEVAVDAIPGRIAAAARVADAE